MTESPDSAIYDNEFFSIVAATATPSARRVVPFVVDWLQPRSVIDVGCGEGAWLAEFAAAGCRVVGVDGPQVDLNRLVMPRTAFVAHDLELPLGSLVHDERFDLAVSLEVAEHLSPERAMGFVDDLVALSGTLLFSAAVPGQGGYGHINEQPHEYWIRAFEDRGYAVTTILQRRFAHDPDVSSWYRSNMLIAVDVGRSRH